LAWAKKPWWQNNKALFDRYPDYDSDYRRFRSQDPLRPHREAVSRELYAPLNGPLHLMYDWDKDSPAIDALRRQTRDQNLPWAALHLEDLGDRQTATLQVHTDIPLEDIRFTLPRDRRKLRHALENLSPDRIVLHHPMTSMHRLARHLDYPVATWETAGSAPFHSSLPLTDQMSPQAAGLTDAQKNNAARRVPAPRSLAGWHRLCTEARRRSRDGVFFYVMDLDRLWEQAPRPANIRPCPPDRLGTTPFYSSNAA